MGKAVVTMTF